MLNTMQLGTWKPKMTPRLYVTIAAIFLVGVAGTFAGKSTPQLSNDQGSGGCANLPSFSALKSALATAVATETSGLDNQMWATLVNLQPGRFVKQRSVSAWLGTLDGEPLFRGAARG